MKKDRLHQRTASVTDNGQLTTDSAFTLVELLVVIAIIAILAALLMPSLIKAKQKAQAVHCMNNNKQLMLAMLMYVGDNNEWLPENLGSHTWVPGFAAPDPRTATGWTNVEYLTDPKYAALAPYTGTQYRIYKCPADNKYPWVDPAGKQFPTVRSCAINYAVGTEYNRNEPIDPEIAFFDSGGDKWRTYGRMSDMTDPSPANLFVFVDQDEYSINGDLQFWVDMNVDPTTWGTWPSLRHNFAGTFAFADGHGEIHKWLDGRTGKRNPKLDPVTNRLILPGATEANPDSPDILWVQARTTALRNPGQ
jgi:prepilin-type N-terminal cleavage/methylation domain-containing protein/prepilin-type processing-associated H-X9-DG protein